MVRKCFCNKSQPNFNYSNETKALYCSSCKLEGMVDINKKNVFVRYQRQILTIQMKQKHYIAVLVN